MLTGIMPILLSCLMNGGMMMRTHRIVGLLRLCPFGRYIDGSMIELNSKDTKPFKIIPSIEQLLLEIWLRYPLML